MISASSAPNASSAPAGTYSRAILNRLLIDLSWASSQLEGSTCSRLDTRALIEHGQVEQGKAASGTQMILNHQAAIELLVENVQSAAHSNSESDEGGSRAAVVERVPEPDRAAVQTVMVDELRRLHEGVLARYDLRPSAFGIRRVESAGTGLFASGLIVTF